MLAKNSITINAELQKSHGHPGIAREEGLQNGRSCVRLHVNTLHNICNVATKHEDNKNI